MTARCRFCRKTTGTIVLQPASPDYIRARRGYRAIGIAPSAHHAECFADFAAFEMKSRERFAQERDAAFSELRVKLAESVR